MPTSSTHNTLTHITTLLRRLERNTSKILSRQEELKQEIRLLRWENKQLKERV